MPDAYEPILDTLRRSKRVLITTHVRPDGDALGTSAAMLMGLRKAGIDAEVLLLSGLPRKYAFIYEENRVPYTDVEAGWPGGFRFDRFDALLVVDTGTWSQLPGLRERIADWPAPKLVVDHHLTQEDWATHKLVVPRAAAAGEIAADLLKRWPLDIDAPVASALFLAVASDTGWFQFASTRPQTLRLGADLMDAGADTQRLYQCLYQDERPEHVRLQTRAMQSLQLLAEGRLAVMTLRQADFADTGAGVGDTENLVNVPMQVRTVEASLLFVEPPGAGPIRVSLRSKWKVDVAAFAQQFGGGGHARAAGLKVAATLDAAVGQVSEALTALLAPGMRA